MDNVINDDDSYHGEGADPQKICITRYRKTGGAAYLVNVQNDNANDLGKAERYDCEIITAQSQRGNPDDQSGNRGDQGSHQNCQQENQHVRQTSPDYSGQR